MNVAILSQYFDPEPLTRLRSLVRGLVGAAHNVQVLTALPNWPDGHYYSGYHQTAILKEQRLGANVIRTFVWPYRGNVTWKRLLNYGSFALSACGGAFRLQPIDVLYVYHPPLTISLPAYLIASSRHVPFIYDIQDIWPEAGLAAGAVKPGPLYHMMGKWADWAYSQARHITVIAPDFKTILVNLGVSADKISVIPNWTDDSIYFPRSAEGIRRQYGLPEDAFMVMYAGNMGSTHGVDCLLQAAAYLKEEAHIAFAFVGTGPEYENLVLMKQKLGLTNVSFLGFIQPIHMPELLAAADLMLVHLRRAESGAVSLPSRMLSYMACGRPMLVASEGAAAHLVEQAKCGQVCEPENPAEIAAWVQRLAHTPDCLAAMGANGRHHYLAEFSEKTVVARLVQLIEQVGARSPHPYDSPV